VESATLTAPEAAATQGVEENKTAATGEDDAEVKQAL